MCGVRKKRKVMVRRAPPARVLRGTTATAPGVDIYSLVRLVSDLTSKRVEQPIIPPAVTIGLPEAAKNIKPMVSSTAGTLQSSIGTETTPEIRTYGTQTYGMGIKPPITAPVEIMKRATPYKSGFLSILPEAQKAKNIGERAIEMATPGISQRALESKVFTEIRKSGNVQIPLPELEQRLAQGQILIPGGGRPSKEEALQRAAEAAGGQATLAEFGFTKP
jgi:hypothetical protein